MAEFSSSSFLPPKDWPAFERATRLLFQYVLNDPNTQNNGRPGQRQHRVDVFGKRGGGGGPLVGVQCKGKDSEYGGAVTKKELEAEVEKTEQFKPQLREFILVTTAPDDAAIQEAARLLEHEVRSAGRDLSIAVWGWGRVTQEIVRYPEAIKAFHPDATPFTDQILDGQNEILSLLRRLVLSAATAEDQGQAAIRPLTATQIAVDTHVATDPLDRHLHDQIDTYRDFTRANRPRTALELLSKLKDQVWSSASPKIKFRLLANIGAAHHRLGEQQIAADFFLEAAPFSPDETPSVANRIAALLIKGKPKEAHEIALAAIITHPANPDIGLQRLQARAPGETVEDVWPTLSQAVQRNENVIELRIAALRERERPEWREIAVREADTHPQDKRLQILKAESVLDRILTDDSSLLGNLGHATPSQIDIATAATVLEDAWRATRGLETPPETALAHNAALLLKILRQSQRAAQILDEAMALGLNAHEAIRLRMSFYRRPEEVGEAIKLAQRLPDTPQSRILTADLYLNIDSQKARDLLAERASFSVVQDAIAAAQVYCESLVREDKYDEAIAEADRLMASLPASPHPCLIKYRIQHARAEGSAENTLDEAVARITAETDFPTRFLVCEALEGARRFDEVVDLLTPHTSTTFDSPALRSLIAAAANSDRRGTLKSLLESLPAELVEMPFYRGARIALADRVGDIRAAEQEIRAYLTQRPRSLEMHLQLMHALFRQNKLEALRGEVTKPASDFDGSPANFMRLAQFKDDFGDWREAHALAYSTLLTNSQDQLTSMGYIGVFLRSGHSNDLEVSPTTASVNTAVKIRTEDHKSSTFIIEPEPTLRPSTQYLAPNHKLAEALLGREINATILMPDGNRGTIVSVTPKELHALHELMDNFQNVFPDAEGFERVRFDISSPDGLQPIADRLEQRHNAVQTLGKLYDGGALPLALVARSLGSDPVDTLVGLSTSGHDIRVCLGTRLEREAAIASIRANDRKGCVIDTVTLHVVLRLNLFDVIESLCGPIGIVDRTMQRTQNKIYELRERLNEPDNSLSWREGKIYRTEISVEQKKEALALLESDLKAISERTTVLAADGREDPSAEMRQLIKRFGSGFVDELRAAQSAGRLLVSEDLALRALGETEFGVRSTWLQPMLMQALVSGVMEPDHYRTSVLAMIDTRLTFISIDAALLGQTISALNEIKVPLEFAKLASRLGGKNADLNSHLKVAFGAIQQFWKNESIPWTARQALVGTLLGDLLKDRSRHDLIAILQTFLQFGDRELNDPNFTRYVSDWTRGHFLQL
jgi:tetratricopeptide (TPR) repeat protein